MPSPKDEERERTEGLSNNSNVYGSVDKISDQACLVMGKTAAPTLVAVGEATAALRR
jgi:hypothetical protein